MKTTSIISAAVLFGLASASQANLINNGGFEAPDIGSGWTHVQDSAPGWEGSRIEVWQSGFSGVDSYNGSDQHGELNSHPNTGNVFSIYQEFETVLNVEYSVSFAYRARRSNNTSDDPSLEEFTFSLASSSGMTFFDKTMDDHTTQGWSVFDGMFTGDGSTTTLMFTSVVPDTGTVGNFLDEVSVTGVSVPEPASIALLGLGLLALGVSRRKAAK
ncbi:MAG: hypothetical protein ACJAYG_001143 [Oceanicoccus sp.]|jgi:hypothetical protein